jgi:hypothetical protein
MTRPDGIYLNLPEDDYHADPALSASGIKKLLQSPADYWFTSVHNPDREDKDTAATVKAACTITPISSRTRSRNSTPSSQTA